MAVLALFWGSGFLWIRIALQHGFTPVQITVLRAALGAAVLLLLARSARQRLPRGAALWRRLAVAAFFCNALPFLLTAYGERSVGSGTAGVLHATTPLWSLLIGLTLGADRADRAAGPDRAVSADPSVRTGPHGPRTPRRLIGLLLGFAGVLLILAPWRESGGISAPGVLALLGAAASYAVAFAYMARALAGTGTAPLALSAAQLAAAAGLSTVALPAGGPLNPFGGSGGADPLGLAAVTVLGVACTGLTFHLNYRLIATEGPTSAATVGYLLPVVSTALGVLVLGEQLTVRAVAGTAVVLAGVFLVKHRPQPRTAVPLLTD
ncbi:DMT family transporter [Kitasatospora sp. NPDC059648]|uniref:DMT family transporter n=1 Tax=Kitasatospora sp. NPDC059648 TaxID=3346894 RepID=UPI0036A4A97C